jgi:glycine cleavage system transcriptional repressor
VHGSTQRSTRGSTFWRCLRADVDSSYRRYPPLPVADCGGFELRVPIRAQAGSTAIIGWPPHRELGFQAPAAAGENGRVTMRRWFVLSAIGRDRPGLVAELARLVYDCDANLEDSRMTILGSDFAVILLCSSGDEGCGDQLAVGAKRLERDHGLTILLRHLESGPRPAVPARGTRLYRVEAAGEDRAGIVVGICGVLSEHGVNITDLASQSHPGPGGSPHYEMTLQAEVPEGVDPRALREALEAEGDRLVIDVALMPS